jgi:hypothetical protein
MPSDVLQRSVVANQNVRSAVLTASGTIAEQSGGVIPWSVTDGIVQDGGTQFQCTVRLGDEADPTVVDLTLLHPSEIYVRPRAIGSVVSRLPFSRETLASMVGSWWRVPLGQGPVSLTPDPRVLRMQSEVVRVVKDLGVGTIDGRKAYHYSVTVDPEKLLRFLRSIAEERGEALDENAINARLESYDVGGEVWIDASSFVVRRLSWDFVPRSGAQAGAVHFSVSVSAVDQAAPIVPPTGAKALVSPLLSPSDADAPSSPAAAESGSSEEVGSVSIPVP